MCIRNVIPTKTTYINEDVTHTENIKKQNKPYDMPNNFVAIHAAPSPVTIEYMTRTVRVRN